MSKIVIWKNRLYHYRGKASEKTKDQMPKKIHSKAGALTNIILEIALWASATENIFSGALLI